MKKIMSAILICTIPASTVMAGSVLEPIVSNTTVAAPAARDWTGFYAGASANFDKGTFDFYGNLPARPLVFPDTMNGTMYGGFVGYNIQRGVLVFGGELAYSAGQIPGANLGFNFQLTSVIDLKGRVGYAVSPNILAYGVVGGSFAQLDYVLDPGFDASVSGFSFGAGLEYKIGAHLIVGAEYLVRNMEGVTTNDLNIANIQTQSAQLRVGWQF